MNKHLLQSSFLKTFFDTKIATTKYLKWQAGIFNNHHGSKAAVNAFQFKVSPGQNSTIEHEKALTHAQNYISQISHGSKFDHNLTKPNLIDGMNKI